MRNVLLGLAGVVCVLAFIGWEAAVGIHDRKNPHNPGNLATALDLIGRYGDTRARAEEAYRRGDYTVARDLFERLAERGNEVARFDLGVMYVKGEGVAVDLVEAQKWFLLAGEHGRKNQGIVAQKLTPEQEAEAEQRAGEWKQQQR